MNLATNIGEWKIYYYPPDRSIVAEKETEKPTNLARSLSMYFNLDIKTKRKMILKRHLQEKELKKSSKLIAEYNELYRNILEEPFRLLELVVEGVVLGALPLRPLEEVEENDAYWLGKTYEDTIVNRLKDVLKDVWGKPIVEAFVNVSSGRIDFTVRVMKRLKMYSYVYEVKGTISMASRDKSKMPLFWRLCCARWDER